MEFVGKSNQKKTEEIQIRRQREQEFAKYYQDKMAAEQATQKLLIKPSLPLIEDTPIDVDKTSTISFYLKVRPNGPNDNTYKKTLRLFAEGTPFEWLLTMRDVREVWKQNSINGASDRASLVRAVLRDDALTQFSTALEAEREADENGVVPAFTVDTVEVALKAVTAAIFPHCALEIQKLWMRRHMKKPASMSYRRLQAKVLQINGYLPAFPGGSEDDKFSEKEILGMLEYALPQKWRKKFDLDGYVPTDHPRSRLLRECEALERNEPVEVARVPRKKKAKKAKTSEGPDKKSDSKYCSEHGWGNHDSASCWTLHPKLKPAKFKTSGEEGKGGPKTKGHKETHAMVRSAMKEQLHELLTTMKDTRSKKVSYKRKRSALKKKASEATSGSDESDHAMDHTPNPSDDEDDTLERVKRFLEEEEETSS